MRIDRFIILILILALIGGGSFFAYRHFSGASAKSRAEAGKAEEHGHEEAPDKTQISDQAAADMQIETMQAGPASIREMVVLTGRIGLNQNTTALVKARFPGIVKKVQKGIGELVKKGETLATVESNDSLQAYPVKSPIDGVILVRNTNIGDVAGDAPLFTIADLSNVWAEFYAFPRDLGHVRIGQKVIIKSSEGELQAEATVDSLLPVAEASSQTVIARATLANPHNLWRSGMTVRGEVVTSEREVPVAVRTESIQRLEGSTVVFVRDGQTYTARKVELGLKDAESTEIKSGLKPEEAYVAKNSFTVKADIGKSGAAHED